MEIKSLYKVGDIEFSSEEEARQYISKVQADMEKQRMVEKQRQEDLVAIVEAERSLYDLYTQFEVNYEYLPDRSNNIKELLKRIDETNDEYEFDDEEEEENEDGE